MDEVDRAIDHAATKLGVSNVYPEQRRAIQAIVRGRDVFVCLPTGFGKTLCFSALPWVFDYLRRSIVSSKSIVIVVSPLSSLMLDKTDSLRQKGMAVGYVNKHTTFEEKRLALDGRHQILFISPELLLGKKEWRSMVRSRVYASQLAAIAIDEAHCIIDW